MFANPSPMLVGLTALLIIPGCLESANTSPEVSPQTPITPTEVLESPPSDPCRPPNAVEGVDACRPHLACNLNVTACRLYPHGCKKLGSNGWSTRCFSPDEDWPPWAQKPWLADGFMIWTCEVVDDPFMTWGQTTFFKDTSPLFEACREAGGRVQAAIGH